MSMQCSISIHSQDSALPPSAGGNSKENEWKLASSSNISCNYLLYLVMTEEAEKNVLKKVCIIPWH